MGRLIEDFHEFLTGYRFFFIKEFCKFLQFAFVFCRRLVWGVGGGGGGGAGGPPPPSIFMEAKGREEREVV